MTGARITMTKSPDYLDLPSGVVIVCPSCGAKNSRTDNLCNNCDACLDDAKSALVKGRSKRVREIIQRHPELNGMVLVRLSLSDLPKDDFYVDGAALKDIEYWEEKANVAINFETAGNFEGAARQFEDMQLWTEAGRVRALGTHTARDQETHVPREREIHTIREREIVLIKCSYCGSLNPQGTLKCGSCGGRL
ncbi:MAG: hypothetical protein MUO81_09600 [Thermoplasmata archaeon]|nr:hypothetical protein [Thermoplasmata archaeon]